MENIKLYEKINEKVYREKLKNGLNVSICFKEGFKKFMVLFGTNLGSFVKRFSADNVEHELPLGVAHFLEHKLFAMEDNNDASNEFSKYGLDVNAYTDYTQTVYLFSGTENLYIGLNLLLDFVQKPYFTDDNVESEKGIICQELKMYLDNPNSQLFNGLMTNLYKEFGYKYDVGGTIEEVQKITKEDLMLCYNHYYHPANMELLIIGDVNKDEVMNVVKTNQDNKEFKDFKKPKFLFEVEDVYPISKNNSKQMEVVIPKVNIGFKLPFHSLSHNESLLNEIAYKVILEYYFGFQTPFYQKLLEDDIISNNLYYNVYLNNECGFISFRADTRKPGEFINEISKRVEIVSKSKISELLFNRMKKCVYGSMIKSLNSIEYIGYNYFDYNIKGSDMFEIKDIIDHLNIDYLKKLKKNFKKELLSSYVIYPKK